MPGLDPLVHQQNRLQIMASLHRNREARFADLRDGLGLTPGNLQSHLARLEEAGYIKSRRVLVDLSFEARYRITGEGARAFQEYLQELERLISGDEETPSSTSRTPGSA